MATIKPFKAFRPKPALAKSIASKPYDVLNSAEATKERQGNDYSFYRINKPEVDMPGVSNTHSKEVYLKGKENLDTFIKNGWLVHDNQAYFYIYSQKMGNHLQYGLVACSSIDDYFNDIIKKHEYTRPDKEQDRIEHMATLSAHIGPVFLTYKPKQAIDDIVADWVKGNEPVYNFTSEDGIEHAVWVINNEKTIESISSIFEKDVNFTYVADGHHRSAASAKVGLQLRENNPNHTGEEDYNFFLSVLFPSNQLQIIDYNRVVKDLNGMSEDKFFAALQTNFTVEKHNEQFKPTTNYEFGLYINKQWYKLTADETIIPEDDTVGLLDISILSNYVIDPILGIHNQRTSDRIDFIGGIRGLDELEKRVDSGEWKLAFAIHPVSINQLMQVADSGNVMPPKSTWFEPKLRSGLFVNRF